MIQHLIYAVIASENEAQAHHFDYQSNYNKSVICLQPADADTVRYFLLKLCLGSDSHALTSQYSSLGITLLFST